MLIIFPILFCSCSGEPFTEENAGFTVSRIGCGYDGCFFYAENGKVFAANSLTGQTAEFYDGGVSECFANGDRLYCVKDKSVVAVKIADKTEKTVFESKKDISNIYANENCLFLQAG